MNGAQALMKTLVDAGDRASPTPVRRKCISWRRAGPSSPAWRCHLFGGDGHGAADGPMPAWPTQPAATFAAPGLRSAMACQLNNARKAGADCEHRG